MLFLSRCAFPEPAVLGSGEGGLAGQNPCDD